MKWCRTHVLEYEHQIEKIFGGRAASGEKAASLSTLRNNTTTSNDVFDPRLLSQTGDREIGEGTKKITHILVALIGNLSHLVRGKEKT